MKLEMLLVRINVCYWGLCVCYGVKHHKTVSNACAASGGACLDQHSAPLPLCLAGGHPRGGRQWRHAAVAAAAATQDLVLNSRLRLRASQPQRDNALGRNARLEHAVPHINRLGLLDVVHPDCCLHYSLQSIHECIIQLELHCLVLEALQA